MDGRLEEECDTCLWSVNGNCLVYCNTEYFEYPMGVFGIKVQYLGLVDTLPPDEQNLWFPNQSIQTHGRYHTFFSSKAITTVLSMRNYASHRKRIRWKTHQLTPSDKLPLPPFKSLHGYSVFSGAPRNVLLLRHIFEQSKSHVLMFCIICFII